MSCLNRSPTYPSTRPTPTWPPVAAITAVVVAVALCLPAVAACGSDESDDAGGSGSGSASSAPADQAFLDDAKATLERGYAGDYEDPPAEGPAAVKGKKVWYLSCGQAFEACVVQANAFKAAGDALGWDVTIQDGKADPTLVKALTDDKCIRRAAAAEALVRAGAAEHLPAARALLKDADLDIALQFTNYR